MLVPVSGIDEAARGIHGDANRPLADRQPLHDRVLSRIDDDDVVTVGRGEIGPPGTWRDGDARWLAADLYLGHRLESGQIDDRQAVPGLIGDIGLARTGMYSGAAQRHGHDEARQTHTLHNVGLAHASEAATKVGPSPRYSIVRASLFSAARFDLGFQRLEPGLVDPRNRLHCGLVGKLRRRVIVHEAAIERALPLHDALAALFAHRDRR